MGILENDIAKGIQNINTVTSHLPIPIRTVLCSKLIFHTVYPTLLHTHSLTDISYISLYLSTKIEETHLKLENLINAINTFSNIKLNRQTFILCEANIIQALDYQFEIKHIHLFVESLCKEWKVEVDMRRVYAIYDSGNVNRIDFWGRGGYDTRMVGLAFMDDRTLRRMEEKYFVDIDMEVIEKIRKEFKLN